MSVEPHRRDLPRWAKVDDVALTPGCGQYPAPRRALLAPQSQTFNFDAPPRRALIEPPRKIIKVPELSPEQLRNLQRARRGAPVRAFLDRFFDGFDAQRARRGLVDPAGVVAAQLMKLSELDPRWGFVQALRMDDGHINLDHWVVGPGGLYLLSTKVHPGSRLYVAGDNFLVDGKDAPYVPKMREAALENAEALAANMRWDLDVMGVIVPIDDRQLTVDQQPYAVQVLDEDGLVDWLVNRPDELTKRQVLAAYNAARNSSSWGPKFGA